MTQRILGLREIGSTYRGILSDVWGVLHNGLEVHRGAAEALLNYRKNGGYVVMITNSPRPSKGVVEQFENLGVHPDVYDAVVTSGDVTRDLIKKADGPIFHLGPDRDQPLFDGTGATFGGADEAAFIVCTGLFDDDSETPEDYRDMLAKFERRKVPFICANPDIVVERGHQLIWCAGSLARLYQELGGEVRVAGKPHPPIYTLAYETMTEISGQAFEKNQLLAIGDGMPTDVAGAQAYGSDLLYISGGIHASEYYGEGVEPDEGKLLEFLAGQGADPTLWMPKLVW